MKRFGIFEKLYTRVEDVEELAGGNEAEDEEVEQTEEEEEGDPDEDEEETSTVDPTEAAQALEIFKALNNPATAPGMMAFLNAQLASKGLSPVTKTDIKDISLSDILKEGFGEEYAFLTDKLSPALEKAINAGIESKFGNTLKGLEEANQRLQTEIASTKISAALDPIIEEMGSAEFDKIAPELEKAMQKYPNQGQSLKTYLKDMISLVESRANAPERTAKIRKNVESARRNIKTNVEMSKVKMGSKLPTIKEAVQMAMQGKQFEED